MNNLFQHKVKQTQSVSGATDQQMSGWCLQQAERLLHKCKEKGATSERVRLVHRLLCSVRESNPQLFSGQQVYLWEQLADLYYRQEDLEQMEACLRTQASLQPGCSDAYLNLGYYLDRAGLKQQAKEAYWEGLRVDPDDQYIIYNLAELHREAGEQEQALAILDQAIAHSSNPAALLKVKGDILLQWGQFLLAIMAYQLALERLDRAWDALRLEIYLRLSTCHQRGGSLPQAVRALEQGLQIDANNSVILHELTRWCCMMKRFREAAEYGQRLLSQDPGDPETCLLLGLCYEQMDQPELAKWYRLRGQREARKQEQASL
ncbi:MAG: tetratricopeptide repeat protein [Bacillota bacterium]|jgi:tetratricopeptide (TPR) repeat protein